MNTTPAPTTHPTPTGLPGPRMHLNPWLYAAAGVAFLHALPSLYWALGGKLLLPTIGDWAVDAWNRNPTLASAVLLGVFVGKVAAGVIPLLQARGLLPWPRFWRRAIPLGAALLVLYGGATVVVGGLALTGIFGTQSPADRLALQGHVFWWDPLFVCWGTFLLLGTRRVWYRGSRRR